MKLFKWRYKYNNKGINTYGAYSFSNGMGFHVASNCTLIIEFTENKPVILFKDKKINTITHNSNNKYIITGIITLIISILLLKVEYSYIKELYLYLNNNYFKFVILALIIGISTSIIELIRTCILIALRINNSTKKIHSAEHMMINYLNQFGRLPKNIKELRKASRITTHCSTRHKFEHFFTYFLSVTLSSCLSGITVNLTQILNKNINNDQLIIPYILIIIFSYDFFNSFFQKNEYIRKINEKLGYILSPIGQLFSTSAIVPEEKLVLAFAVGTLWFKILYFSQFQNQDIDQWNKLLEKYNLDIIFTIPIFTEEEFENYKKQNNDKTIQYLAFHT